MKKYNYYEDDHHVVPEKDDYSFESVEEATAKLIKDISQFLGIDNIVRKDMIFIPEWNVNIIPKIVEMSPNVITSHFYFTSPDWNEGMFECSTGAGSDQKTALGMSISSFVFGIIDAMKCMFNNENPRILESEFAGHKHSWNVYLGNIVGMGDVSNDCTAARYWDALKDEIKKRIGNRKICYVKIYGANDGSGNITGECRINDTKSEELSAIVADMVSKWENTQFASHKQFFMIKQDEETYIEPPYTAAEIMEKTELAMKLFESCETQEQYEKFSDMLLEAVGDKSLAWELESFIPEICARNAFTNLKYPESVIMRINGENTEVYLTQLYSYYAIVSAVFRTLDSGILKDTNKTYREYISVSSVYSLVCDASENGRNLEENGGSMSVMFSPDSDYILR